MANDHKSTLAETFGCLIFVPIFLLVGFIGMLLILAIPFFVLMAILKPLHLDPIWEITVIILAYVAGIIGFYRYKRSVDLRFKAMLEERGGIVEEMISSYSDSEPESLQALLGFLGDYKIQVIAKAHKRLLHNFRSDPEWKLVDSEFWLLEHPKFESLVTLWENHWDVPYYLFLIQPKNSIPINIPTAWPDILKLRSQLSFPCTWIEAFQLWQLDQQEDLTILSCGHQSDLYCKRDSAFPMEELLNFWWDPMEPKLT